MDGKEMCKFCGLEFGNKSVLKVHYSIVHQGDEQINRSDSSIQGIPPEKNMNFETTMKTKNKKKTLKSNFLLKEDWNQYCKQQQKLLCEQQNTNLIENATVKHNIETENTMLQNNRVKFDPKIKYRCAICS